jgi:hypothetical protein
MIVKFPPFQRTCTDSFICIDKKSFRRKKKNDFLESRGVKNSYKSRRGARHLESNTAGEGEGGVGGDDEHRLPDDALEVDNGGDEEDLGSTDEPLLTKEHEEAPLVEGVHTEVASLLGTTHSALLLVEEGETNIGVVGTVDVTVTRRERAGQVQKRRGGALGIAVSNAEREGAPVTNGTVLEENVVGEGADGNNQTGAEPSARRRDGNKGKELVDTIGEAHVLVAAGSAGSAESIARRTIGNSRASVVGDKHTVSVLLLEIDKVVVDKVLDNDTGRVHKEGRSGGSSNKRVDIDRARAGSHRSHIVRSSRGRGGKTPGDPIVGVTGFSGSTVDRDEPNIVGPAGVVVTA